LLRPVSSSARFSARFPNEAKNQNEAEIFLLRHSIFDNTNKIMTAQLDQVHTQLLSQQPPPSILLPRSEALRYVEICELAEMMPSSNNNNYFLNQLLSSSSGSSNANNNNGEDNNGSSSGAVKKYSTIIQMAFLLYLGEYVHARHLWRRHRSHDNSNNTNDNDEYKQLAMFWNTAKYCYLWSTGGISSSLDSADDNDESSNLPYSTLMLRSLQFIEESSLEPLATYSKELVSIFRYRVNDRLRSSFGDIRQDEFMLRMNLNSEDQDYDILGRYGWKRAAGDATHLVPNEEWQSPMQVQGGEDNIMSSTDGDRIHQLSEVVMFLEQTKMNA
jgi:hypothetical protein